MDRRYRYRSSLCAKLVRALEDAGKGKDDFVYIEHYAYSTMRMFYDSTKSSIEHNMCILYILHSI